MSSAICFNLDHSKILSSGNELKHMKCTAPSQQGLHSLIILYPLPKHEIMDVTKLKAFADYKLKLAEMTNSF